MNYEDIIDELVPFKAPVGVPNMKFGELFPVEGESLLTPTIRNSIYENLVAFVFESGLKALKAKEIKVNSFYINANIIYTFCYCNSPPKVDPFIIEDDSKPSPIEKVSLERVFIQTSPKTHIVYVGKCSKCSQIFYGILR